jgi:hypothetical protein
MELSDYIIEIDDRYGIFTLNVVSLKKEDLNKIAQRDNDDYLALVIAIRTIGENITKANQMRLVKYDIDDWFDTDLHLKYRIEAVKKSFMACRIRAGEEPDDEEREELNQMLSSVENIEQVKKEVEEIKTLLKDGTEGPMSKFLGVRPSPFFVLKTSVGQEYSSFVSSKDVKKASKTKS